MGLTINYADGHKSSSLSVDSSFDPKTVDQGTTSASGDSGLSATSGTEDNAGIITTPAGVAPSTVGNGNSESVTPVIVDAPGNMGVVGQLTLMTTSNGFPPQSVRGIPKPGGKSK